MSVRAKVSTGGLVTVLVLFLCPRMGAEELARWRLNERKGLSIRESEGRAPAAILGEAKTADSSDPTFARGALDFDGENDFVDLGSAAGINTYDDLTVMAWIWSAKPVHNMMPICQNVRFYVGIETDGHIRGAVSVTSAGKEAGWKNLAVTIPLERWTHFALVYDKQHLRIYIDGKLEGERVAEGAVSTSGARKLYLGRTGWSSASWFDGMLAQVVLMDHAAGANVIQGEMAKTRKLLPPERPDRKGPGKAPGILVNGGFEGDYTGGVAQGWRRDTWGAGSAAFSKDPSSPRGGVAAQKIAVQQAGDGEVGVASASDFRLEPGTYQASVYLRGDVSGSVMIEFGDERAPARRSVAVSERWERFTVDLPLSEVAGRARLRIVFAPEENGFVAVDDADVVKIGEAAKVPPAKKDIERPFPEYRDYETAWSDNLVYNSSFEVGTPGWAPLWHIDEAKVLVSDDPHGGRFAMKLNYDYPWMDKRRMVPTIQSRHLILDPQKTYVLSFWAKASGSGGQIAHDLLSAYGAGTKRGVGERFYDLAGEVRLSNRWKRYEAAGKVHPTSNNAWTLRLRNVTPDVQVFVDDIQIEEGELRPYVAAKAVEASARTIGAYMNLYDETEDVAIQTRLAAPAGEAVTLH